MEITCFKAYDVRGRIPDELNPHVAYRIANATVEYLDAKRVVVCRDIRLTSDELATAVQKGIVGAGAEAIDIGVGGTEQVYFATAHLGADAGIMVTASHNPADYNGLKIVREDAKPVSEDTGLATIKKLAESDERQLGNSGKYSTADVTRPFVDKLLSFIDVGALKPLKLVVNPGNGGAGLAIDQLEYKLPFDLVKVHYSPDGTFPNGIPNPMLPENQSVTSKAVVESGAAMGIAWDGDFDRCFLFDENGTFIEGYYIVGLLAEALLAKSPGAKIVHDPRMTWNTLDILKAAGGEAVKSKSGHSFIKEKMREVDALYGGEMSAHHYFREFSYADSGMIPWLLVAAIVSHSGQSLSTLVDDCMLRYPSSGEINREVADAGEAIRVIGERYGPESVAVDETDGVSIEMENWRFNLRASNTEPVIRLNVESRGDTQLMQEKTAELLALIDTLG